MIFDHTIKFEDTLTRFKDFGYDLMLDKTDISDTNTAHIQVYNKLNHIYIFIDLKDMIVKCWTEDVSGQRPVYVPASIIHVVDLLLDSWRCLIRCLNVETNRLTKFFKLEKFKNSDDSEVLSDLQD